MYKLYSNSEDKNNLEKNLRKIEICELNSGLFNNKQKTPNKLVFNDGDGWFLLTRDYGNVITQWKRYLKPILYRNQFPLFDLFQPLGKTSSYAETIRNYFGNSNLVAIYSDYDLVAKFYSNSKKVTQELEVIEVANQLPCFRVPKIVLDQSTASPTNKPVVWFEKIKTGKQANAMKCLEALLPWYEMNGIDLVNVKNDSLVLDFQEKNLLSYGWNKHELNILLKAIDKLSKSNLLIPTAWIHGDAHIGNFLETDEGEIFIIDWTRTKRDYIIKDVSKLIKYDISIKIRYKNWFSRNIRNYEKIMPADLQLLFIDLIGCSNLKLINNRLNNQKVPIRIKKKILAKNKEKALSSAQYLLSILS